MAYNRSVFPEGGFDTFPELFDLPPERIQDAERYQTLKKKVNKTPEEIIEYNNLSISLAPYQYTPEVHNKIADSIVATQKTYVDNVQGFIELKQEEFQAKVDSFDDVGDYNPSTRYYRNNMFRYNGFGYIVLAESVIDITPVDDGVNYRQFTIKGEQGVSGSGLAPRGQYNSSITYTKDDLVIYDNKWWVANQTTNGNIPNTSSAYWNLYLDLSGMSANGVLVADTGGYFDGSNVEEVTQEIGEKIDVIDSGLLLLNEFKTDIEEILPTKADLDITGNVPVEQLGNVNQIEGMWNKIDEITLGVITAQLDINIIENLKEIKIVGRNIKSNTGTNLALRMMLNGDNSSNAYSMKYISGTTISELHQIYALISSSDIRLDSSSSFEITIKENMINTSVVCNQLNAQSTTNGVGKWRNYAPINEISLLLSANSFAVGSTFEIWGR